MIHGRRVAVGTGATPLNVADSESVQIPGGSIIIQNLDATNSVDIGDGSVTTGNGYQLKAGQVTPPISYPSGELIAAVAATGTVSVAVLQVSAG